MDIHNIALVRATDVIPFDGVVYPVKDKQFIKKETGLGFAGEMRSLLKRKGILNPIDWQASDEERQATDEKNKQIASQYMPYTSMYNSMVLWSLNGLVPDDNATKFSQKSCAIIDGLEEQIEQADIVSIVPTDTAVKGTVTLSKNAKILISKERYDSLSQKEKEQLAKLDLTVDVFDGDLKTSIDDALVKSGRYTAENLRLASEDGGYKSSPTSEEVIGTIKSIAQERDIPQLLHGKIFEGEIGGIQKLEGVKGEKNKCDIVSEFYMRTFLEYILPRMDIDELVKGSILSFPNVPRHIEDLCDEIGRIGIDKYKQVLDEYNQSLEKLRDKGKLPTPQQIVDAAVEDRKIDLISMMEQERNPDTVLASAIEATEQLTTISAVTGQKRKLEQIEIENKTKETEIK